MTGIWALAALWLGLALIASLLSIWLRISTALSEIVVGMIAQLIIGAVIGAAVLGTDQTWIKFLSGLGAIVLTFLASAELDPDVFKLKWKEAAAIGLASFLFPFLGCTAGAYFILGWEPMPSWLAGVAMTNAFYLPRHLLPQKEPQAQGGAGPAPALGCHERPSECCRQLLKMKRGTAMFKKILHANDGSKGADKALALGLAKQEGSELHIVCVEEIPEFPETIGEVKNEKRVADRRYRGILKRAEALAEEQGVKVQTHLLTGHPVRNILILASELGADLLVIGATGHSIFYGRLIGGPYRPPCRSRAVPRACGKVRRAKAPIRDDSPRLPARSFNGDLGLA